MCSNSDNWECEFIYVIILWAPHRRAWSQLLKRTTGSLVQIYFASWQSIFAKLLQWCPHPVGHISRNLLSIPPNHSSACSRCPPCPQPGHQTKTPFTGSFGRAISNSGLGRDKGLKQSKLRIGNNSTCMYLRWHKKQCPIFCLQLLHILFPPWRGLKHEGHDSWKLNKGNWRRMRG